MIAGMMRRMASSLLFLFGPIFIYTILGESIVGATVYFLLASALYFIALIFCTQVLNKVGFKRSLSISLVMAALYAASFAIMTQENIWYTVPLSLFFFTWFRFFHWVPFLTDFSKFTKKGDRGRQTSAFGAVGSLVGIIMPIVGGWLIMVFGTPVLFVVITILYIAVMIPYSMLPHTEERFSWNVRQTWNAFKKYVKTHVMVAHVALGGERLIGAFLWPIFIFEILEGNYFEVGALSGVITLAAVIINLFTGKFIDKAKKRDTLVGWGSVLYGIGWVIKIFVLTAFQIFIVDVYHRILYGIRQIPFDTATFEIAADEGSYVDEYTVLREMSIHFGRVVMAILILILLQFLAFQWVFVFAAIASILMVFITARDLDVRIGSV